jgi:pyruvate-ferredoxin/flavodoxin oxidoreductase
MAQPHDDPRDVVLQAERAVSAAIFSTAPLEGDRSTRVATAADALLSAASAAQAGKRASAVLSPHELVGALDSLHAVARGRAPIVVHVIGREGGLVPEPTMGLRPAEPGSAPYPGRDEIAPALDVGAGVLVSWSAQESVDLTLAARRAAEDAETPFVLVTDGAGPVMSLPGAGLISKFLGDEQKPRSEAPASSVVRHVERKRAERSFAARVPFALSAAMRELGDLTGRPLAPIERYETTDADEIVVGVGQAFPAAREAAEALRKEGRRVGAVGVRVLRPFFPGELVKALARARAVAVIEPLDIALAPSGPLATSLKAAFADALTWAPGFPGVGRVPPIVSVVFATIEDAVSARDVREAVAELAAGDRAKRLIVFGSEGTS